jgi:hypothetical protein
LNLFKLLPESLRLKIIDGLKKIRKGLAQETVETHEMLKIYISFSQGKASKEEMEVANRQFRDFLKTLGLGAIVVLPFSPITLPLIVKFGKKLGIDVIPSSFKNESEKETTE